MAKPTEKTWPELKAAWDAYGHGIKFEDLVDLKSNDHGYIVVCWMKTTG